MPASSAATATLPFTAFIAMGSNLGDRLAYLQAGINGLAASAQIQPLAVSPIYETAPVGPVPQGAYLNAVLKVQTSLCAEDLLRCCLQTESRNGRIRTERFGPRTLDLDLLLHSAEEHLQTETLILPHPRLHERAFVLTPFASIAPELIIRGQSVSNWLAAQPQADRQGVHQTPLTLELSPATQPSPL